MDHTETKRTAFDNNDSKSRVLSKINLDYKDELSTNLKVSNSLCYVCAVTNPQHLGFLFDGRLVNYCGDCFAIILEIKEMSN